MPSRDGVFDRGPSNLVRFCDIVAVISIHLVGQLQALGAIDIN